MVSIVYGIFERLLMVSSRLLGSDPTYRRSVYKAQAQRWWWKVTRGLATCGRLIFNMSRNSNQSLSANALKGGGLPFKLPHEHRLFCRILTKRPETTQRHGTERMKA